MGGVQGEEEAGAEEEEEEGWHKQTMQATVLNRSPSLGSWRRRHASATSSPLVIRHIKAGDFFSAHARMLFLLLEWLGLLAKSIVDTMVIIPQVFGWRAGPSHLCQNNTEQAACGHSCGCVSKHVTLLVFFSDLCLSFLVDRHSGDISITRRNYESVRVFHRLSLLFVNVTKRRT